MKQRLSHRRFPAVRRFGPAGLAALTLAASAAWAQTRIDADGLHASGNVLGSDVLYSIGGGRAVSMGPVGNMQSIGVGAAWNSNLVCGDMSITTTLQNQLNGVTNGFQSIMSNVIQNATSAVASLPALIIQRADPGLYNLLTNGILQARLDFDRSKMTCRAIANRMADMAGGQTGWDQLSEGMALKQAVSSTDAVSAIERAEANKGNSGVPWVGGSSAGGSGQAAIKVVGDVTRAGYNLLNGRGVTDTSSINANDCNGRLTCQTWTSPQAAATWATRVLGEREQRTCQACNKTATTPGAGLTPLIQEEYETKLKALQELVSGAKPTTAANLDAAGSASLPVTRGVIEALRDEPDQDLLGKRLASEVALASVMEKALLLQRTLLTGRKEPNVAANELATKAVDQESGALAQEIQNLKTELELRRELAGNSPMALIQRHSTRAAGSRGIYQGDPTRDRVQEIQKPRSTP
ncbi:integrating conjugative element protein [Xanthomonas campestris pv. raphani]|uniref:integrating conjugative element protein n=1 Tax=Xanthomonas campestris TaxID=339 RepID=UPI0023677685|nr:integrating conjugative element protein [Xanthomonas campestris]MEA9822448.1 integrating conjugative element protein [Xanthomonas campestris pv. raphani]MEA9850819.1 integrating conjugative element protein [Xanthomonas campestris pv. raphani]MEA9854992.1 integrating conjugative element protein [Xanthomonas campestris pv. raphani]MEA9963891.1 integrating conjugative element protein [Xanthomonas campestris pv. raphani]WDJ24280.1 integrating conjugative element protein [Xanthomonas campestris 